MSAIDLVKQFYEHLANGNKQGAYSLLSESFILKQANSLPYGGEYVGINGLDNFFEKFFAFWKEFKTLNTDYYISGDKVFAISKIRGVTRDINKIIETEMIQVYTIVNEKLTSAQPFYFDTKELID